MSDDESRMVWEALDGGDLKGIAKAFLKWHPSGSAQLQWQMMAADPSSKRLAIRACGSCQHFYGAEDGRSSRLCFTCRANDSQDAENNDADGGRL